MNVPQLDVKISLEYLKKHGAYLENGHYVLTGGDHSPWYFNLRRLAGHTQWLDGVSERLYYLLGSDIDVYIGAGSLGQALSMLTATWSPHSPGIWCDIDTRGCEKRAVFDPKLSHFGDLLHDKRVAIVDDTLTTGETLRQVTALVEQHHGQVVSAATIIDRSQDLSAKEYGVPEVHSLLSIDGIRTYPPDECPQCLAKKPINLRPGHGERWLRKNSAYPQAL